MTTYDPCCGKCVSGIDPWHRHGSDPLPPWYDDRSNMILLFDWLGDMRPEGYRGVVEKPWNWTDEYATAVAAREHESETGHTVLKNGVSDVEAYCNDCDWQALPGVALGVTK